MEDKIMKPYPLELRLRVVAAYEEGQGTIFEIAALFHVGLTFIKKALRLSRNGESLEPKHGGGAKPSLNEVNLEVLRAAVETRPESRVIIEAPVDLHFDIGDQLIERVENLFPRLADSLGQASLARVGY